MIKTKRREAEMVNETWFKYFHKTCNPVFSDEICLIYEQLLERMYGDFFDRNLHINGGTLLSLGVGFGLTEIPLARKGYNLIGIDNDIQVLDILKRNAKNYAEGRLEAKFGDLYDNFHEEFLEEDIQACISFGVLEHFTKEDLVILIQKQFKMSPLIICMMPIRTPNTLKAFRAEHQPEGHIDENGIYRNFWTENYWKRDIFKGYKIVDKQNPINILREHGKEVGQVDMVTYAIR